MKILNIIDLYIYFYNNYILKFINYQAMNYGKYTPM